MPLTRLTLVRGILFTIFLFVTFWLIAPGLAETFFPGSQYYFGAFFLTRIFCWFIVALLWNYSKNVEHRSLIILEHSPRRPEFYLFSVFGLMVINYGGAILLSYLVHFLKWDPGLDEEMKEMKNLFHSNNSLLYLTALTAGVTEELIFRGYLQTRITELFRSSVLGIFVSASLFALMHLGSGSILSCLFPFFIGLVNGIYYQRFKSMHVVIIVHFLWDVFALYALLYAERG